MILYLDNAEEGRIPSGGGVETSRISEKNGVLAVFYRVRRWCAMQRVTDLADPLRCKGAQPDGQCRNRAEDGSDYCLACGGVNRAPARRLRQYLLAKAQDRVRLADLAEHEEVKSLRDEIALARMLIERRFNLIQNDADLMQACAPLNTLLLTVERLVKSAHAIEKSLGTLLARNAVLRVGQQICQVIVDRLEGIPNYEQTVDAIIADIVATISKADNSEDESAE